MSDNMEIRKKKLRANVTELALRARLYYMEELRKDRTNLSALKSMWYWFGIQSGLVAADSENELLALERVIRAEIEKPAQ